MITMEGFMDIHSLHRDGLSKRAIARKLGMHRNTVKAHLEADGPPQYRQRARRASCLDPYKQIVRDYLEQDNYRATWLFDRLRKLGYSGSYETLRDFVRPLKEHKTRLAYIRFETEPGFQAQVDFGDFQVVEPDGRTTTVYAFVMALGYSRALYVEYLDRCTLETFLDCHINAFGYFGGVPAEILYDNMKHVVVSRTQGRPNFNIEFLHFAHHYGCTIKACPAYSPWVKGKVERPMDYIRERFWRGYSFSCLEILNRDMRGWLDETANRRVHGTHHLPVNERWRQETALLGKLPPTDYDTCIKLCRTVYADCQISYNANRYLIPHHLVGKKVLLKIKHGTMRIFHDHDFIVSYRLASGKHELVGNRLFYDQLRRDQEMLGRKYAKSKGKATRGLVSGSLFPSVAQRPLAEYDRFCRGGVAWNN